MSSIRSFPVNHIPKCQCCVTTQLLSYNMLYMVQTNALLSGEPDYFGRNKISSGGDLSHYSSASLY